jgi:hypothetical protein
VRPSRPLEWGALMRRITRHTDNASGDQTRLVTTRTRTERANRAELLRLIQYLYGRGWTLRKQIRHDLAIKDDALRALVRYSNGLILSSSALGYRLTTETPVAEAGHAVAELLSRANQLRLRASEIQRVMYRPRHDGLDGIGGVL